MAMRDLIVRNGDGRPRRQHRQVWRGWPAPASSAMTMLQVIAGTGDAREKARRCRAFVLNGPRRPKLYDRPGRCWACACLRSCSSRRCSAGAGCGLAHGIPIGCQLGVLGAHLPGRQLFDLGRVQAHPFLDLADGLQAHVQDCKRACCCICWFCQARFAPGRDSRPGWFACVCCKRACCRSIRFSRRSSMRSTWSCLACTYRARASW
jgi:hypothetical protein